MGNNQSLNNEFHSCDMEKIYGNIFEVSTGGGGALRVFGGSYIMDDGGSPHYLLNIAAGASLSDNNNTYTFNGIQTEAHSTNNRLVEVGAVGAQAPQIVFNECNFTATNGAREQVNIVEARLTFNRCVMTENQGDTYSVTRTGGGL